MVEPQRETPVTPAQIRAGRALVNWSQEELAKAADVGLTSVRDLENERRGGGDGDVRSALQQALENGGVQFLAADVKGDGGPGVRLHKHPPRVLRRPMKPGKWDVMRVPIEWRGQEYMVLVEHAVLDDFGRFRRNQSEAVYVDIFEKNRARILKAAATAIDAGRAKEDGRVLIDHKDVGLADGR